MNHELQNQHTKKSIKVKTAGKIPMKLKIMKLKRDKLKSKTEPFTKPIFINENGCNDSIDSMDSKKSQENDQFKWSTVETYDDLLNANLDIIHGILKEIPYHQESLKISSHISINDLDQLHRYGLLITNGQKAECVYGQKMQKLGCFCDNEQCGYIEFYVHIKSFVDTNNNIVIDKFINKIKESNLVYRILNMETSNIESNIRNGSRYNVTRYRRRKQKSDLCKSTPWFFDKGIRNNNSDIIPKKFYWNVRGNEENFTTYAPNKILKNTLAIVLAMPQYGIGTLEKIIIGMCKDINLKLHDLKKYDLNEVYDDSDNGDNGDIDSDDGNTDNNDDPDNNDSDDNAAANNEVLKKRDEAKKNQMRWASVKNYDDLLSANLDFINGFLPKTPYFRPPPRISQWMINNLNILHRYGILSVNEREAIRINRRKAMDVSGYYYEDMANRGYLEFHIDIDTFVDSNNNNVVDKFIDKIKNSSLIYRIYNINTSTTESNIPHKSHCVVSRFRRDDEKHQLKTAHWIKLDKIYYDIDVDELLWDTFGEDKDSYAPNRILKNTLKIMLIMPKYGNTTLEATIIDICKDIDLKTHELSANHQPQKSIAMYKNPEEEDKRKESFPFLIFSDPPGYTSFEDSTDNLSDDPDYTSCGDDTDFYEHHAYDDPWLNIENYDDLLNVNLDFVHGLHDKYDTPYQRWSFNKFSHKLIKNLDLIHRYGLLTINGQESNTYTKYVDGCQYDFEQRGYLCFHIDPTTFADVANHNAVKDFIRMIEETDLIYAICDVRTSVVETNLDSSYCHVTRCRKHEQAADCINKRTEDREDDVKWNERSCIQIDPNPIHYFWNNSNQDIDALIENTLYISLVMPEYGKGNLEDIIIDICKQIGLKQHDLNKYD